MKSGRTLWLCFPFCLSFSCSSDVAAPTPGKKTFFYIHHLSQFFFSFTVLVVTAVTIQMFSGSLLNNVSIVMQMVTQGSVCSKIFEKQLCVAMERTTQSPFLSVFILCLSLFSLTGEVFNMNPIRLGPYRVHIKYLTYVCWLRMKNSFNSFWMLPSLYSQLWLNISSSSFLSVLSSSCSFWMALVFSRSKTD